VAACSCFLFAFFDLVRAVAAVIPAAAAVPVGIIVVNGDCRRRSTTTGAPRGCEDGAGSSLRSLLAGDGQAQVSAPAVCVCSGSPTDSLGPPHTPARCYCRRRAHRSRRHTRHRRRRRRPHTAFTPHPLSPPSSTLATPAAPPRTRDARVRSVEGPADVLAPRPLRAVGRRLLVPRQAQHDRALDLHRASRRVHAGGSLLMISITRNTVRSAQACPPTRTLRPRTCPRT
jgi:hypothetical protein